MTIAIYFKEPVDDHLCLLKKHENFLKPCKSLNFSWLYGENDQGWSRSRNFRQAGAGAGQKWTGSATLGKLQGISPPLLSKWVALNVLHNSRR
jgi:hypothetical protein